MAEAGGGGVDRPHRGGCRARRDPVRARRRARRRLGARLPHRRARADHRADARLRRAPLLRDRQGALAPCGATPDRRGRRRSADRWSHRRFRRERRDGGARADRGRLPLRARALFQPSGRREGRSLGPASHALHDAGHGPALRLDSKDRSRRARRPARRFSRARRTDPPRALRLRGARRVDVRDPRDAPLGAAARGHDACYRGRDDLPARLRADRRRRRHGRRGRCHRGVGQRHSPLGAERGHPDAPSRDAPRAVRGDRADGLDWRVPRAGDRGDGHVGDRPVRA